MEIRPPTLAGYQPPARHASGFLIESKTMNQVIPFAFDGKEIRVIRDENGEPLFVGKDICEALGYSNPNKAMSDHCKGVTKRFTLQTDGGVQQVRVLTEGDMYRLMTKSKLESAERFEALVFDEILPTIRKTGKYEAQQIAKPAGEKPTPLPSATAAFKSMHSLAKLVGLSGNQAILSANNAVFKYHGVNCLNLLDHQALTAEDQRGRTYTATGLGNEFLNMSGRCGAKVNKMLEASGLIGREQATNRPIPTDTGAKHGEWADTGKQHGGAPIKEWRWFSSVVDLIQPIAA